MNGYNYSKCAFSPELRPALISQGYDITAAFIDFFDAFVCEERGKERVVFHYDDRDARMSLVLGNRSSMSLDGIAEGYSNLVKALNYTTGLVLRRIFPNDQKLKLYQRLISVGTIDILVPENCHEGDKVLNLSSEGGLESSVYLGSALKMYRVMSGPVQRDLLMPVQMSDVVGHSVSRRKPQIR